MGCMEGLSQSHRALSSWAMGCNGLPVFRTLGLDWAQHSGDQTELWWPIRGNPIAWWFGFHWITGDWAFCDCRLGTWDNGTSVSLFHALHKLKMLRILEDEEITGLDISSDSGYAYVCASSRKLSSLLCWLQAHAREQSWLDCRCFIVTG